MLTVFLIQHIHSNQTSHSLNKCPIICSGPFYITPAPLECTGCPSPFLWPGFLCLASVRIQTLPWNRSLILTEGFNHWRKWQQVLNNRFKCKWGGRKAASNLNWRTWQILSTLRRKEAPKRLHKNSLINENTK